MSLQGKGVMLSGDRAVGKRPLPIATSQGWFALFILCKVAAVFKLPRACVSIHQSRTAQSGLGGRP